MRLGKSAAMVAAMCMASAALTPPVFAASIRDKTEKAKAEIPTCSHKIGALAVREPDNKWWQGLGLESPEALLKLFVQRSGCFTLVDRGKGFEMAQQERALAAGGGLQAGANIGGGQLVAADYILVPDVTSKNANSGGTNIGGMLGAFGGFGGLGGAVAGAIVSNISISKKTADVILTVTNVRTGTQDLLMEGHADKTDVGFGVGGGGFGGGVFGGAGVNNYANTEIGQVVILAYIDAYSKMVTQMGGLSDAPAQTAPAQTLTMSRPGRLYATASDTAKVIRPLNPGMALYPTGNKDGIWVEVSDEVGNKGWVPQVALENAK